MPAFHTDDPDLEGLIDAAQKISGTKVEDAELLAGASPRSVVARLTVVDSSGRRSVVAKRARAATVINQPSGAIEGALPLDANQRETEADERFAIELAAYERLEAVSAPGVPRLLGSDRSERILLLEFVAGEDIVPMLFGSDTKRATDALVALATGLADVHAAGMSRGNAPIAEEVADAIVARTASVTRGAEMLADAAGVAPDWRPDLEGVLQRLSTPGPFATWLHGDPCPGNVILRDGRAWLVDFESSWPGHAALEAAYLRAAFPTCWCIGRLDPDVLGAAEQAYRQNLATVCKVALDDGTWTRAIADACCLWALDGNALVQRAERGPLDLVERALDRDWMWGTATARQRLALRLERAADATEAARHAPRLTELLRAGRSVLVDVAPPNRYPALAP